MGKENPTGKRHGSEKTLGRRGRKEKMWGVAGVREDWEYYSILFYSEEN